MADLLDRRQREAAALLLTAIDLPAPMDQVGQIWAFASEACPGLTMDQLRINSRRDALERARDLVSELLSEAS